MAFILRRLAKLALCTRGSHENSMESGQVQKEKKVDNSIRRIVQNRNSIKKIKKKMWYRLYNNHLIKLTIILTIIFVFLRLNIYVGSYSEGDNIEDVKALLNALNQQIVHPNLTECFASFLEAEKHQYILLTSYIEVTNLNRSSND